VTLYFWEKRRSVDFRVPVSGTARLRLSAGQGCAGYAPFRGKRLKGELLSHVAPLVTTAS